MHGLRTLRALGLVGLVTMIGCGPTAGHKKAVKDLGICTKDLDTCRKERRERDKTIAKLQGDNEKLTEDLQALGGKVTGLEGEKGQLSGKLQATQKEIDELRKQREAAEKRMAAFKALAAKLRSMIDSGKIKVEVRKGRMIVKMSDKILFDPGKTAIKVEGQAAILQITEALRTIQDRDFVVAGHTDNIPIRSRKFLSNWELSTARAVEVVRFMIASGMDPVHVSAAGFGEFDPVGDNAVDEGRAQNRRIEIIVMPNVEELPKLDESALSGN